MPSLFELREAPDWQNNIDRLVQNTLKLYGAIDAGDFEDTFYVSAEKKGCIVKDEMVYATRELMDRRMILLTVGLGLKEYRYSAAEISQGRGNRREEEASRAAVRQWLEEHSIEKPMTVIRRLREAQEKLLRQTLMDRAERMLK